MGFGDLKKLISFIFMVNKPMREGFELKFVKSWPLEEIVDLYKAGGWWREEYKKSEIKKLIKSSYAFAVVVEKSTGKAVGMGRILSDGVSDAYIQDLVILKEYRGRNLGKYLVRELVNHCKSNGIKWISLIAEPNQYKFYEKLGFKVMKNYTPMKYEM